MTCSVGGRTSVSGGLFKSKGWKESIKDKKKYSIAFFYKLLASRQNDKEKRFIH